MMRFIAHILYYTGLVGFCLTGQVISLVWYNPLLSYLGLAERCLIILYFLAVPVLLLVILDRTVDHFSPRLAHALRHLLILPSLFFFFNQWRYFNSISLHDLHWSIKVLFLLAASAVAWGAIGRFAGQFRKMFQMLGVTTLILSLVFVAYGPLSLPEQTLPTPRSSAGPVVILMFDSLSREALLDGDSSVSPRFPNFRRLAAEGYWLPRAFTDFDHTRHAVPTFLTGRQDSGPRNLATETTLFDLVGDSHACHLYGLVIEYYKLFSPRANCRVFDHSTYYIRHRYLLIRRFFRSWQILSLSHTFSQGLLDIGNAWLRLVKRITPDIADDFLGALSTEPLPGHIYYLHLFSPHTPYLLDASGLFRSERQVYESRFDAIRADTDYDLVLRNYLEEIEYDDHLLGQVIDILKRRQVWDSAILVVTSDHGECWEKAHLDWHTANHDDILNDQTARIPFFLKPPAGRAPLPSTTLYQHHRFVPTLLDLLSIPASPELAPSLFDTSPRSARNGLVMVGSKKGSLWTLQADSWVRVLPPLSSSTRKAGH